MGQIADSMKLLLIQMREADERFLRETQESITQIRAKIQAIDAMNEEFEAHDSLN